MARSIRLALVAVLVTLVAASPAFAHKLRVFATVVGEAIEGRVYFVGGSPALGVPVVLTNGAGEVVATVDTVPPDGTFSLTVAARDTYTLRADAQDGHVAEFTLPAARFAETLPLAADASPAGSASPEPAPEASAHPSRAVDEAMARQLAPLLDEIDALRETLAFRDILGSAGIILGVFGAWALWAARKPKR